jgi:hypothetical protein
VAVPSPRPSFDRSLPATGHQRSTALAADFALAWTLGVLAGLVTRQLAGAGTPAPLLALLVTAELVHAVNAIVLAGVTGRTFGARVAQTAEVCSRTGRPVGVRVMAHRFVTSLRAYDPRTMTVSLDRG